MPFEAIFAEAHLAAERACASKTRPRLWSSKRVRDDTRGAGEAQVRLPFV